MDGAGLSVPSGLDLQSFRGLQCRVSVDGSRLQQHFRCINLLDHFFDRGTNLWKHSRALVGVGLGSISIPDLLARSSCVGGELFNLPVDARFLARNEHGRCNLHKTTGLDLVWLALGIDRAHQYSSHHFAAISSWLDVISASDKISKLRRCCDLPCSIRHLPRALDNS